MTAATPPATNAVSTPLMSNYGRQDIAFVRGEGCWLIDANGKRYFDSLAGVAVNALGHSHAGFIAAVRDQVGTLAHVSNHFQIPLQTALAAELCKRSGMQQAFFCNSGTESIEAAIKLARKWGHNKGITQPVIIVTEGAFHGRTLGALTATHSAFYQEGFGPLPAGFVRVAYNDVAAMNAAVQANKGNVVGILVEPAQGEGGVHVPAPDYLNKLRALCDTNDLLLMLDEVQTGNGRCGKWFAYQLNGILPDILATAKGLGNGFPIGATLAAGKAAGVFQPGHHGSTFGGSPLACRAGLAVYEALDKEDLVGNAARMGQYLLQRLQTALAGNARVKEIRGMGLLIGIELEDSGKALVARARELGLIMNVTADKVIRLIPPLIISKDECDFVINTIVKMLQE
ncbi:MAG TPA: aspartate aminotransferase family protein [Candidatus Acidoferrum sp.]|nr:aspartate aminotransferase family protein [Candidatus Acidoferrum sp.]